MIQNNLAKGRPVFSNGHLILFCSIMTFYTASPLMIYLWYKVTEMQVRLFKRNTKEVGMENFFHATNFVLWL